MLGFVQGVKMLATPSLEMIVIYFGVEVSSLPRVSIGTE